MTTPDLRWIGFGVAPLLAGCGAGIAGVVASSGSDSSSSPAPAITAFQVENPKVSPALLRIEASASVLARLSFSRDGSSEAPMTALEGVSNSQVQLAFGMSELTWDFAAEAEIGGPEYEPVVDLFVRRPDGTPIEGGTLRLGIGNDPPVMELVDPMPTDPADPSESSGNVEVRLGVSDTSSDVVAFTVEWRRADDPPDVWQPATAAGVFPQGVETLPHPGVTLSFFWNTSVDLADGDDDVLVRVTADDGTLDPDGNPIGMSEPLESALLHVDNNEEPIVQLLSDMVVANPDELRGIPIPFRVFDDEEDVVEVIFQWRHEDEAFPSLDRDGDGNVTNAEVDEILADPVLRQEHHVCTRYPRFAEGRIVPLDASTVRLPELASSQSWVLAQGIVGRTLELLRPSSIPRPITPTWGSNPLASPIAALPLADGLNVLVLDSPGQARLREIELATGAIVREISVLGPGLPSAMALERYERGALVALDDAGTWRIVRVELASGAITELVVSDGSEPAPVRGIASLGTHAAVFTAGTSLFLLDHRDPLDPQLGRLLTDLASPRGVVVDPLASHRLYLAERDANRVLAIELDSLGQLPVVVKTAGMLPGQLEAPEALALERDGTRLLVVTDAPAGGQEVVGLDLGASGGNATFAVGTPSGEVGSVASGQVGLRLVALPDANEILVAGGIVQRRTISVHSTVTHAVSVEPPFAPLPQPGQPWRVPEEFRPRATAQGVTGRFVWDSRDGGAAPAFIRALARDAELGLPADGAAGKHLRSGLDVAPLVISGSGVTAPRSVAADLDADGDLDLVSANENGHNLTILFQDAPRSFQAGPLVLGGPSVTHRPVSVAAADLDSDGDLDVVSANAGNSDVGIPGSLTVFFQLAPGSFQTSPLVLDAPGVPFIPSSVAAADLDSDGDQDLVAANFGVAAGGLMVFYQLAPGSFQAPPQVVCGACVTVPSLVAAADLDSDGDQDLVTADSGANNLAVFFQDAPGSFQASPLLLGGPGVTDGPVWVAAADLDSDGDQDIVSANVYGDDLTVFFQDAPAVFQASPLVLETSRGPASVVAADLDSDGDQDLVGVAGFHIEVFHQLVPGEFQELPLVLGGFGVTGQPSVTVADLDSDGRTDIVAANFDTLAIFFQAAPGSFDSAPLTLGGFPDQPLSVAVTDLDSDGDQDLVVTNTTSGTGLTVFSQDAPGIFEPSSIAIDGYPLGSAETVVADLDSDGDQDVAAVDCPGNNLTVLFQLARGVFDPTPLVLGGPGVTDDPFSAIAADLDSDGDRDLLAASGSSVDLRIFFQLAPGVFDPTPIVLGGPGVTDFLRSVVAADLDSDGDQDLVVPTAIPSNLNVFFQVAPGTFDQTPLVLGGPGVTDPTSVAAADLDSDGDQDLVAANGSRHDLTIFFQDDPGGFDPVPLVVGGPGVTEIPFLVVAADLDSDGDQDLISANAKGASLTVFHQLSPGRFETVPQVIGAGVTGQPHSIVADDVDGDGDRDLVVTYPGPSFADVKVVVFWSGR